MERARRGRGSRGAVEALARRAARGDDDDAGADAALEGLLGPGAYRRIREALAAAEGFDLDAYRPAFLARRFRARLAVVGVAADAYARRVEEDADERRALLEALGVNVTQFFRDPAVWAFLETHALPPLLDAREGRSLRAASLGCAGGQEAYGLAMLLLESARGTGVASVDVDAFDADPEAVRVAAEGAYATAALEPLSAPARDRYFRHLPDGRFAVEAALRRAVHVQRRDLLTQPLPRRYDLVFCRNVMIYMSTAAKEDLLAKVEEALAPDGLLVLGQSEVVLGEAAQRYRALSPRHRVYRKAVDAWR